MVPLLAEKAARGRRRSGRTNGDALDLSMWESDLEIVDREHAVERLDEELNLCRCQRPPPFVSRPQGFGHKYQ